MVFIQTVWYKLRKWKHTCGCQVAGLFGRNVINHISSQEIYIRFICIIYLPQWQVLYHMGTVSILWNAIDHVCHHVGFTIISMQHSVQVSSLYCGCAWLYSISSFCFVYMWPRMRVSNYLNLRGHLVQQGVVRVYNVLHLVQRVI